MLELLDEAFVTSLTCLMKSFHEYVVLLRGFAKLNEKIEDNFESGWVGPGLSQKINKIFSKYSCT